MFWPSDEFIFWPCEDFLFGQMMCETWPSECVFWPSDVLSARTASPRRF